jgi:ketosteroid isomerase-like protein
MELPYAHIWTIRDGLVTHLRMYWDRHSALEAAGLAPG